MRPRLSSQLRLVCAQMAPDSLVARKPMGLYARFLTPSGDWDYPSVPSHRPVSREKFLTEIEEGIG